MIEGNFIGVNPSSTNQVGNGLDGVHVQGADRNTVGGSSSALGNVISGNGGYGIRISGAAAIEAVVRWNTVGAEPYFWGAFKQDAVPNRLGGILIDDAPEVKVLDNLISGNGDPPAPGPNGHGIEVRGSRGPGAAIVGNNIGLRTHENQIGNSGDGVRITGMSGTLIASNLLSGNVGHGLHVSSPTNGLTTNTVVVANLIGTDWDGFFARPNGRDGIFLDGASLTTLDTNLIAFNGRSGW